MATNSNWQYQPKYTTQAHARAPLGDSNQTDILDRRHHAIDRQVRQVEHHQPVGGTGKKYRPTPFNLTLELFEEEETIQSNRDTNEKDGVWLDKGRKNNANKIGQSLVVGPNGNNDLGNSQIKSSKRHHDEQDVFFKRDRLNTQISHEMDNNTTQNTDRVVIEPKQLFVAGKGEHKTSKQNNKYPLVIVNPPPPVTPEKYNRDGINHNNRTDLTPIKGKVKNSEEQTVRDQKDRGASERLRTQPRQGSTMMETPQPPPRESNAPQSNLPTARTAKSIQTTVGSQKIIGDYELGDTIGKGTFGKVWSAIHLPTQQKVAVKIIEKKSIKDEDDWRRVNREIEIMKNNRHPNIVQLYQVIETESSILLVNEFAENGELFELLEKHGRLKERTAGRLFIQLLNAVEYLHRLNVAHRDLKPENILLDTDFNVKLIDFGLSNYCEPKSLLDTACGSPCYASPQMIAGKAYNGQMADVWSLGIIFYGMVCGSLPFEDNSTKHLYGKIMSGLYAIPSDLSLEAIELMTRMLVTEPSNRITISELRQLRFFKQLKQVEPEVIGIIIGLHPMPLDNQIIAQLEGVSIVTKQQLEDALRQNVQNKYTTRYYLLQKKVLREGGKTNLDLQIFLETHSDYRNQYGKQSLFNRPLSARVEAKNNGRNSDLVMMGSSLMARGTTANTHQFRIRRKGLSKMKPGQSKFASAEKSYHHRRVATTSNQDDSGSKINTLSPALMSSRLPQGSRSKSKAKPTTARKNEKNLAQNLWDAYLKQPLETIQPSTIVVEQKSAKMHAKDQQRMAAFTQNVKRLKDGFMKAGKAQRTSRSQEKTNRKPKP